MVAYHGDNFTGFSGIQKDYAKYSNPDNDPNGDWIADNLTVGMSKELRPNQFYDLVDPATGRVYPGNPNRVWAFIPESMKKQIEAGRIIFPEGEGKRPLVKRYKKNLKSEVNPVSTWIRAVGERKEPTNEDTLEAGLNAEGTRIIQEIFGASVFNYAKPLSLIASLIRYTTDGEAIMLDSFAGSGTTGHAVITTLQKMR